MARQVVRSGTEHVSNLPFFKTQPSKDFPDWLLVWCQKEGCPSYEEQIPFLVDAATIRAPLMSVIKPDLEIQGRPCPYCSRVSRFQRPGRRQRAG